jgi:ornithine decarboxylase
MASMYGLAKRSIPTRSAEAEEERKIVRFSRPKGAAGKKRRRRIRYVAIDVLFRY